MIRSPGPAGSAAARACRSPSRTSRRPTPTRCPPYRELRTGSPRWDTSRPLPARSAGSPSSSLGWSPTPHPTGMTAHRRRARPFPSRPPWATASLPIDNRRQRRPGSRPVLRQRCRLASGSLPGRGRGSPHSSHARGHPARRIGPSGGRRRKVLGCGSGAMLATGRGERRPATTTDCHAAARISIVPCGDTAVTMPTATACSCTDSPSAAATSGTSSASPATSTTTPAMGECRRYRQGRNGESEREHSKHCHVGTAFLRPTIGLGH
jgi:hypothetical protein